MICAKCQGRKKVRIGPQPHDLRDCSDCGGTGNYKPKIEGKYGNVPQFQGIHPAAGPDYSLSSDTKAPKIDWYRWLEDIDIVNNTLREKHTLGLREAARRGARIVADHRIRDGDFTILVSPGDFARIMEK